MDKDEIAQIINKRLRKIDMLFREIICGFDVEAIHEFRTEIKKLRAFFRLLNVETDDKDRFKISKKMKAFYRYIGTIRNLQLQMKNMEIYVADPRYTVAKIYIEYLQKIIEKWKVNATGFMGAGKNFYKDEKKQLPGLPEKLKRNSSKKFLQNKIDELTSLVKELPDDDVIHSIRKILKDILYNWGFVKTYKKLLPSAFSEEEKTKLFTELLGLFLDKNVAISLLETYCRDSEENGIFFENEITQLQELERRWKKEKEELAQIIYAGIDWTAVLGLGV